jgi:hypothetical protein
MRFPALSLLACAAALGLGAACGESTAPYLTFKPEEPDNPIALGLESFVDVLPEWQDGKQTRYHLFEKSTLAQATRGGAEVLWTELHPNLLSGRHAHRIHYRCGEDVSLEQYLDVTFSFEDGEPVQGAYRLPCKAATSFEFTQGYNGRYRLGQTLLGIPELRAGGQKLEGRGIRLVNPDGPLFALPGTANHFLYARAVRPGTGVWFRAGPREIEVPVTVYPDAELTFRVTRSMIPSTYNGVEVIPFEGQMYSPDGHVVYGARDCQPTVTPASAEYLADIPELCTRYTRPGQAAQVCMTFRGQSACESHTP